MGYLRDPAALAASADQGYRLYKPTFVERMTTEQAETIETLLNAHELVKLRLMYNAENYFVSTHSDFALLHWELCQHPEFGEVEADRLLAPDA